MTNKIFRSALAVAVVVLLCGLGVVMGMLYNHFSSVQVSQLRDELSLAVTGTEQYGNAFLENVESSRFRLTWIGTDGTVLYDTQVPASTMVSHADREEFQEALASGSGSGYRYSDTVTEKTIYEARRLQDGTVLRISASQASAAALLLEMLPQILTVVVAAILLSALLARRVAWEIVEPLNRLDLENPLSNDTYGEIRPLLQRINQQHLQINAQLESLRRKTDEFDQITRNMQEGLVLLDAEGRILSLNPRAKALFDTGDDCAGRYFLHIARSGAMRDALNAALDRGFGTAREQRGERHYRFDLRRITSDGQVLGAVLLAFDITEETDAERMRREFSANVSHELKTPLQSIMGCAELMESGLVRQEDQPQFVGRIRKESARLLDLVEDIIRLSQLDEGVQLPRTEVELLTMAREAAERLQQKAQNAQVSLTVAGTECKMLGVRGLLQEMIDNLCDNAVKYNRPGGSVRVEVTLREGCPVLTVTDTGIGIPRDHQSRIFERFYRVDKSHSKASGGTGLGLSIVKHSASAHGARVTLDSEPGRGTRVEVVFPAAV